MDSFKRSWIDCYKSCRSHGEIPGIGIVSAEDCGRSETIGSEDKGMLIGNVDGHRRMLSNQLECGENYSAYIRFR